MGADRAATHAHHPVQASGLRKRGQELQRLRGGLRLSGTRPVGGRPSPRTKKVRCHDVRSSRDPLGSRRPRGCAGAGPGQGDARPEAPAPAGRSVGPASSGQAGLRPGAGPGRTSGAFHRVLRSRLSRGRSGAADQRADVAGHAAVPKPELGQSGADRLPRTVRQDGAFDQRLARPAGGRYLAAAGRARC